jgi:hypothetical protein
VIFRRNIASEGLIPTLSSTWALARASVAQVTSHCMQRNCSSVTK